MLGLAKLINRGRFNACLCAVAGSFVPLLAPATISLVALTQRFWDAGLVLLWAVLLPIIIPNQQHWSYAPTLYFTVCMLLPPLLASTVLKVTRSWVLSLLAISILATTLVLASTLFIDLNATLNQINQFVAGIAESNIQVQADINLDDVLAMGVNAIVIQTLLVLLIARWWQSELFHSGAFGNEFRALRLDLKICVPLVLIWSVVLMVDTASKVWQLPIILPLVVAGCSLIHWYGHQTNKLGSGFYVVLYVTLFIYEPTRYIVASLALIDAVINLRSRLIVK